MTLLWMLNGKNDIHFIHGYFIGLGQVWQSLPFDLPELLAPTAQVLGAGSTLIISLHVNVLLQDY